MNLSSRIFLKLSLFSIHVKCEPSLTRFLQSSPFPNPAATLSIFFSIQLTATENSWNWAAAKGVLPPYTFFKPKITTSRHLKKQKYKSEKLTLSQFSRFALNVNKQELKYQEWEIGFRIFSLTNKLDKESSSRTGQNPC